MTKIQELSTAVKKFQTTVTAPIKAAKGGTTWKDVQKVANLVPAALASPIASIEQARKSRDGSDRAKIPTHIKTMKSQFAAIKLTAVQKYQAAHGPGGAKQRGLLSTAAAKREEAARVALCDKFVEQHGQLKRRLDAVKKPEDLN